MKSGFSLAAASLLALCVLTAPIATAQDELNGALDSTHDQPAHGRGSTRNQIRHARSGGAVVQGNGINYHGGPVMHGAVNLYFIWYGNWGSEYTNASNIINAWATAIGGSSYENINTTYGDATGNVSGQIHYAGFALDAGSQGTSLSDNSIANIVSSALTSKALPVDTNAVYMVLTAPGVKETSGFITSYCGWHTYGTYNGSNIKYAFIGDAAGPSLGNCAEQTSSSPNGDPAVDAMVSVMAHELEESTSDPNLNAWYDSNGEENADKCAWTFGTTHPAASNGSKANMNLGGRDFLIQQNWLNLNGGSCALAYNPSPNFSLSVSPSSQSVAPGGTTGNYTVTATSLNGYQGMPVYTVTSGLPSGATASVNGDLITIATTTLTAAGTYVFTITGTDSGAGLTNTTTATLVVNAPPSPSFTLSMSPSSNTVKRPGSASYTVTITPVNNFTGTVALSASPNKTGLQYSFSSISGGQSILTVTVSNSAKRGTTTITVTGKSGTISKTATASLQVQ